MTLDDIRSPELRVLASRRHQRGWDPRARKPALYFLIFSARELDTESQFQCRKLSKLEPCLQWPSRLVHSPKFKIQHALCIGWPSGLRVRRLRRAWTIWPSDFFDYSIIIIWTDCLPEGLPQH